MQRLQELVSPVSWVEYAAYRLAIMRQQKDGEVTQLNRNSDQETYNKFRLDSLRNQFYGSFSADTVRGKTVLDFGSGAGGLAALLYEAGAAHVIGCEISESLLHQSQSSFASLYPNVEFRLSGMGRIAADANSCDVITCFDVMEHVVQYEEIIREWRRVLVPGGRALIWWSVWLHPYGHHFRALIPLPWIHIILSDRSISRIASRVYRHPSYQPRYFHFDASGNRKRDPYADQTTIGDLNKLTTRRFERVCAEAGFRVKRTVHPVGGGLRSMLARSPWPDLFASFFTYELIKI